MIVRHQAGLGVAPLIIAGAAAGGAVAYQGVKSSYESGWFNDFLQLVGLKATPTITMSTPAAAPPPAPKTAAKMNTWTPEDSAEAMAQKQQQFDRDTAAIQANAGGPSTAGTATPLLDTSGQLSPWLIAACAVGGASILLLVSRR